MSQLALDCIAENIRTKNPVLDLGNCGLTELYPELLEELAKTAEWLETLRLGSKKIGRYQISQRYGEDIKTPNRIANLPTLPSLGKLTKLVVAGLGLTDCVSLSELTQLNTLDISSNQISDCTPLSTLAQLEWLDLSSNQIDNCTPLAALTRLYWLNISLNQISDCTPLLALSRLRKLDISKNKINDCTALLSRFKKELPVKWDQNNIPGLYLHDNPINNPPMEILKQGGDAVIRYFKSGRFRPLNECKLIFVGDGGVGKTSLMRRLVGQHFNPVEPITHGINKLAWRGIQNPQKDIIQVNLWDFGGQHVQHSLHQFFFTERVIYVLVLNPRNDEKAGYWLEQITALGKGSQVLVVYNWKDEKDKEANYLQNFYELRKTYSHLPAPFLLSCKTGEGIPELAAAVKNAVLRHEGLKAEYPATWFNIKARLERDIPVDTSYIGYDIYQQWCNEAYYTDSDAQKQLLLILDSIGSIVFFDRPVLNEYPVLNPEWITTGAYAILVAPQTKDRQGHLGWNDLRAIFREKKSVFSDKEIQILFTEKHILFILELMLTYDLCQKNPFTNNAYLIPAAFGEQPGKNYSHAKKGARQYRLKFEAPFEMLIIHRFIAKNLQKITDRDYWQSGIYIKHPGSGTFALVETNLYSKEINCWIKGDNVRGFWEVIRADFREILSLYKNLAYAEEVLYTQGGKSVFLPYNEMLKTYSKGILRIEYHPTYDLENINVLEVLELFEQYPSITGSDYSDALLLDQKAKQKRGVKKSPTLSNKAPEIFFSYAWGEEREKIVDQLYAALQADNYAVKRDKKDVQYGDLITHFMDKIGAADCILVAISDKYLRSEYCMYELHKAFEQSKSDLNLLQERIYPIRVEDLQLDRPAILKGYIEHWESLETEWEDLIASKSTRIGTAQQKRYNRIKSIAAKLGDLLDFLSDLYASTTDILSQDNFATIKQKIQERMRQ